MGGLFITGTDTAVGKTAVTGILARMLVDEGLDMGIWKPVQSGNLLDDPDGDTMRLRRLSGLLDDPAAMCCRAVFEPLAPSLALCRAGISLKAADLLRHLDVYRQQHRNILAEGAGGLCVPLVEDATVADLACTLGWPILIVARAGLGTVNHTALTAAYARSRGLHVLGVVISGMPAGSERMEWANVAMIEELAGCPVLAVLPWFSPAASLQEWVDELRRQWPHPHELFER